MSRIFVGFDRTTNPAAKLELKPESLLRHAMALGSSGSGKTVFCKIITEEVIRNGIPAILIDPQGDLCSLALFADNPQKLIEKGVDPALAAEFAAKVDPVIFTPASRKGVAMSADPIASDMSALPASERVHAITNMASMIVSLLGYDLDSDDGAGLVAVFDRAIAAQAKRGKAPRNLDEFTAWLLNLDDTAKAEFTKYVDAKKLDQASQKLARLDVGARRLLFHEGLALDIDLLLGRGPDSAPIEGKTRLSIIYLNTLNSQEDKEFFVAALTERLYSWMLRNPSQEPQALFYIDEVAPFIPPVRKPACKPALSLLFKQARKYGVCCLMATQNPADVDYKAMAQFGTWALGRLTTRQDMAKVQPTVKALDPVQVDTIMEELPALTPGQFILISPDNFKQTHRLGCRWLYTKHETLDDERIEKLIDDTCRERLDELEARLKAKSDDEDEAADEDDDLVDEADDIAEEADAEAEEDAEEDAEEEVEEELEEEPATPSAVQKRDAELEESDSILAKASSMSAGEFASKAGLGEGAARTRLRKLEAAGRARSFKAGRVVRYWSLATGLRPDLGLDRKVKVLVTRVTRNDAERLGRELRETKTLGFIGEDEEVVDYETEFRLVLQLSFREKVTRALWQRILSLNLKATDELTDHVYLHPGNLKVVLFDPQDGVLLVEKQGEYASKVVDFDNHATFTEAPPAQLKLVEAELRGRQPDEVVKDRFKKLYNATPKSIQPVFIPVWKLHMQSRTRSAKRIVTIDALAGRKLEW
jgi:DNA helicase HerA-like ATPase